MTNIICKKCKENKKNAGRGMCKKCYDKWYFNNNSKYREKSKRKWALEKARNEHLKKLPPEQLIEIVENGQRNNNNFRERN